MILIVTARGDLHAHAVQTALRSLGYADVHIFECDQISGRSALSWKSLSREGTLLTREDQHIDVSAVKVIWWRRVNANQEAAAKTDDEHARELVNNDCRGTLAGILSSFQGRWVSAPEATTRASNKIHQLTVAAEAGFRIPKTLVSQSKAEVLQFVAETGRVIVKPVVGAAGPLMFTQFGDSLAQIAEASFSTCPATYQEYIEGDRHLRLNVFGDDVHAAVITTTALDWRPDLNVPISSWPVGTELENNVRAVLAGLGLRMGVVDLKLTPSGEPVWLEVNPQGQFLFLEPLLGEPLAKRFASFLVAEAEDVSHEH